MPPIREILKPEIVVQLDDLRQKALADESDPYQVALKDAEGDESLAAVLFDIRAASRRSPVKHPARSQRVAAQMEAKRPV